MKKVGIKMSKRNSIHYIESWDNVIREIDRIPDNCPLCNHSIEPLPVLQYYKGRNSSQYLRMIIVCMCPRNDCKELFFAKYGKYDMFSTMAKYELKSLSPFVPPNEDFEEHINELSAQFGLIYNQASTAERFGLDQIAGMGYRKALEFLIKDYCIKLNQDKEDEIKRNMLGKCINLYVENTNIKEVAKRAAWIGNDETHYERRWEEKDINDLKVLIKLTLNWISTEYHTKKYIEEMD